MSREAFTQVLASLAAAISLLERGGKKAAASDRMFEQMLDDYRAALEAGRDALSQQAEPVELTPAQNELDMVPVPRATLELCAYALREEGYPVLRQKLKGFLARDESLTSQTDADLNAKRYQWLRDQTWNTSSLCVVTQPKESVKLGCDCPFGDRLDAMIDAELAIKGGSHE